MYFCWSSTRKPARTFAWEPCHPHLLLIVTNSQKFVLSVVGARPQFIKAAVVSRQLVKRSVPERLVHTGQHYDFDMSRCFFEELGIAEPVVNLGVGSGSHASQTAAMLVGLERLMQIEPPSAVLVYGDTNSTLAGALVAAKLHIPVLHVEAGLRSRNRRMPEEVNRVVTDRLSSLLFAPSKDAVRNLLAEGVDPHCVLEVGDVMYDAVLAARQRVRVRQAEHSHTLVTVHRAENTDNPERLASIFQALAALSHDRRIVLPLHPRTRARLEAAGIAVSDRIEVIPPVGYHEMVGLEATAELILTDSGGVQKEAYFHRVPCITLREETEWPELVDAGWNVVVPPLSAQRIVDGVESIASAHRRPWVELYGDGRAGERIAEAVSEFL